MSLYNNTIKKKWGFYFLLFFCVFILSAQETPKVIDNKIYFSDGKTQIQMESGDNYHIFPMRDRVIYINCRQFPNFREYTVSFFNFGGRQIARPSVIRGEMVFIFSETKERILAGQRSLLTKANESFLYNMEGDLINKLTHDYATKQIGITEDEKYFWFVSNRMRTLNPGEEPLYPNMKSNPYNYIMVFDVYSGNFIVDYSTGKSILDFVIDGKNYSITLRPPDIPG